MMLTLDLLTLLLFFSYPPRVASYLSFMGKEFYLGLPKLIGSGPKDASTYEFFLTTLCEKNEVTIYRFFRRKTNSNSMADVQALSQITEVLPLQEMVPTVVSIKPENIDDVDMGLTESYSFLGLVHFALTVMLMMDKTSVDTFVAIPVEAWGKKYYVTTLKVQPFIQIVSASDKNAVSTIFNLQGKFNFTYGGKVYKDGDTLQFTLDRGEAFVLSKCKDLRYLSMSGTKIVAQAVVGVVCGNCASKGSTVLCNRPDTIRGAKTTDTVAEMMFPVEAYGTEFVLIDVPQRLAPGYYLIVSEEVTKVNIYITRTNIEARNVNKILQLEDPGCCKLVKSLEPVQITYVQLPACLEVDEENLAVEEYLGDASMALMVPNSLFYVLYIWRAPEFSPMGFSYARVVLARGNIAQLVLDGSEIRQNLSWSVVPESEHHVGIIHITPGTHRITGKQNFKFGCYIYGLGRQMTYMHPAGFQDCNPIHKVGDFFDNDCDGHFDEEISDKIDNDGDSAVDEDLAKEKQVCPPFFWGDQCQYSCENCAGDCDTKTGICSSCASGFKRPMLGCSKGWTPVTNLIQGRSCSGDAGTEPYCWNQDNNDVKQVTCESNEFGADCGESCEEKCGGDCKNKKTGECFTEHKTGIKTVLLLIPIVVFLCCVLISKRRHSSNSPRKSRDRSQIAEDTIDPIADDTIDPVP